MMVIEILRFIRLIKNFKYNTKSRHSSAKKLFKAGMILKSFGVRAILLHVGLSKSE